MTRFERVILLLAVFAAGALLMSLEVAAFRIIGKTFGAALRETTTVIAVFLTAMSVGYWAGGRAADRWPTPVTLVATLFGSAGLLLIVPWVDAAIAPRIAASGLPLFAHAFLATTVLFAAPTFLLAATSPIAVRLFTTDATASGTTAGSISAISTIGSIVGSVITAFFLIDWLASTARTVLFVALLTSATAILVVIGTRRRQEVRAARRLTAVAASALALVLLSAGFVRSAALDQQLLAPLPGTKILFVGDSPYHRVTVRERGNVREMQFNVAVQTSMRLDDPNGPGTPYTSAFHIGPALRPEIRRILLIGLGGGTMVKQFLRAYPEAEIDAVEIDPLVVKVAREWFALPEDPRVRIHVVDGRSFAKNGDRRWDLIVIDAYTSNRYGDTIPAHLTTREFFEELRGQLAPHGIVHFHCAFEASRLMPALERTIGTVFPYSVTTSGEILASNTPFEVGPGQVEERLKASPVAGLRHFAEHFRALAPTRRRSDVPLLTDDYAPVDSLLR